MKKRFKEWLLKIVFKWFDKALEETNQLPQKELEKIPIEDYRLSELKALLCLKDCELTSTGRSSLNLSPFYLEWLQNPLFKSYIEKKVKTLYLLFDYNTNSYIFEDEGRFYLVTSGGDRFKMIYDMVLKTQLEDFYDEQEEEIN